MNIITKYSSTLANDTSYGSSPWFNIVSTPNTNSWGQSHAQTSDLNLNTSNYLKCTNFGFSIPSVSVIVGITVEVHLDGSSNTETINSFRLVKNNVVVGNEKGDDSLVDSTVPKVFGSSSDLWGTTWTAADINNVNFGLVLACEGYTSGSVVSLIGARITVNYISSQHSYVSSGSLYISKFGSIDEDFSVDLGQLIQSNSDSGYSVNTGANIVSGYVTRNDDYPSGYASPAILYASCASNFESEIKFVLPSEYTGDGSPNTSVYLFYRIKNSTNYRSLKISWVYDIAGPYKFIFDDEIVIVGALTDSVWPYSITPPTARKNDVVIFKLKVINNKLQIKFNNLNSLDSQTIERDLFYPTIFASECGVGFGFDSDERLRYITSIPSALSFRPDYFNALSTSYESLGIKHNPSGTLTLSGTSLTKLKHKFKYISSGSLTISGSALFRVPRIGITGYCTGGLILSGTSTDQTKRKCIASGGVVLSGTALTKVPRRAYLANGTLLLGSSTLTNSSKRNYTSTGSLILSNTSLSKIYLKYTTSGSLILSGNNTPYRRFKLTGLGGLVLSKAGLINEDFSVNFGVLKNSNSDAGYSVLGAGNGGQIGDGSGGLSYNGYVVRTDAYPSGYASPAVLYAPSSPNFTAEIKFVCPNEDNNTTTDFNISLFYRYKNSLNYRELRFGWYFQAFSVADIISNNGSISTTYLYTVPLAATRQFYIILKFRIVDDQIQIIFNNLNTLFVTTHQETMQSPSFLANEGGIGFGFDSNEKLVYYNTTPGSTSFKPDYFKVANIPYENLGGKFNTNGGLTLSGSSLCRIKYAQTSNINLILSGTAIAKTPSVNFTGGLVLSKVGIINEDFSVNFGVLKNSNSDTGYSVLGAGNGGQVGDGSGGLSYDGYVVRSDAYPSGYRIPATLYAPSSPNFTAEMKFVCPSEITGSLADVYISLFYRYKNSLNYRELRFGWYYIFSNGTSRFYIDDVVSNNGVISTFSWFGIPPLIAEKQSYIILKFRIVDDQIQVIFNNLNTSDVVVMQQTMTDSSFLVNEGGIGFGFDSNEKLKHINLDISSTSFKPDYFKVANIPYENLGGRFNTNGGLTLSGNLPIKIAINYLSSGSLQLSSTSTYETKSAYFILDGNLILSGQAICIAKNINYLIDFINNPLTLNDSSIISYKTNYQSVSDGTLLIGGDSNEFYRIDYVTLFNGGLILGGNSLVNYQTKYTFNGGLILGGTSIVKYQTKYTFNGGLILGGTSIVKYQTKYTFNGGLILGGTSIVKYQTKYTFNGGLILGGTSLTSYKASYHVLSGGSLILGGTSLTSYKANYYVLSGGSLILGGTSNVTYKFVYKYQPTNVNLILSSSNLIKYSINLRYLLNNSLLKLFGKAKGKNRFLINNGVYVPNNINVNEVKLISTKKEDVYLQWQLENNVVISKFANK